MRKYISSMILILTLLLVMVVESKAAPAGANDQSVVKVENRQTAIATVTNETGLMQIETDKQPIGGFLAKNWGILSLSLLSFLEVITRLTPTEKDNTVLNFLSTILNAIIPNFKKGGGRL